MNDATQYRDTHPPLVIIKHVFVTNNRSYKSDTPSLILCDVMYEYSLKHFKNVPFMLVD